MRSKGPRFLASVAFLLAALWIPAHAHADDQFKNISPEEMKINSVPGEPGAEAIILEHDEVDNDQQHVRTVYVRLKVLTEAGKEYGDVEIPYIRHSFDLRDIKARTIEPNGTIVDFKGKPFDKTVIKSRTIRYMAKTFSLPDVQVGSILEYRYSLYYDPGLVYSPEWQLQGDLFQRKVHFTFIPYDREVVVDHNQVSTGVAWTWNLPKNVVPKRNGGKIELEMSDVPAFHKEAHMPPASVLEYNVHFYYQTNTNPKNYWKAEGKFWDHDIERFMKKDAGVSEQVAKLISPTDSPEMKARKIYAFVASLTNLSYKPQLSAQEQKTLGVKQINSVEDVLSQKAGYSDDLTSLYIAMARAAGLKAWAMMVTARDDSIFQPEYLNWDQLTDEIAIVQVGDQEVYLSPGTRFCPYGMLPWQLTGSKGVRQSPTGGTEIAPTPPPDYRLTRTVRLASFLLTDKGLLQGTLQVAFTGQEALVRRLNAINTDAAGRKHSLEQEIKGWLPDNAEVHLISTPAWDDPDQPLEADFTVSTPALTSAGHRMLLPLHIFEMNEPPMFTSTKRVNTIYFSYPGEEIDQISVKLPSVMAVDNLPPGEKFSLPYAMYMSKHVDHGGTLELDRSIAMGGIAFPVSHYDEIKGFYDKVKQADGEQLVLKLNVSGK